MRAKLIWWFGYLVDKNCRCFDKYWSPARELTFNSMLYTMSCCRTCTVGLHVFSALLRIGDPKNTEVRRFVVPLLIIWLSWELIIEGLRSKESAELRSAISAWVRECSSWSYSPCFWISWMMTFMLVSSMEEIRGTAPMFRLLSAAVTLPRCSDIFLFGIVGMLVEFFSFEENELNDCNKKSINLPQS